MKELLGKEFLGNTILIWVAAASIIIAGLVLSKLIYWFISKFVEKLTKKSKTKLDDIFVAKLKGPLIFFIIIFSIHAGTSILKLPKELTAWIEKIYILATLLDLAYFLTNIFEAVVDQYFVPFVEKTSFDLDEQLLPIIRKGVKAAIWIITLIIGLDNIGYDVSAVIAGLGIGGLAFALAAQDSISNLFGGFTIFTDKPFKINDRIKLNGMDGFIKEIGLRSSKLQTLEGRIVTIPNSKFANNPIENISSEPSRKVVLNLGLTYDMDYAKVKEAMATLKEISGNNSLIEDNVVISFNAFGDFSLNILFVYFIKKSSDLFDTQTEMNLDILKAFSEKGLEFAFPTQTIFKKEL